MQTFRLSYKRLYFLTCNREETTPSELCCLIQMFTVVASVQMMSTSYWLCSRHAHVTTKTSKSPPGNTHADNNHPPIFIIKITILKNKVVIFYSIKTNLFEQFKMKSACKKEVQRYTFYLCSFHGVLKL